ncbi:hypothetical protein SAY86_018129 [Trapa natans]|uniref:HVA22-like protein n=1 Tax=Trapa natans TaxID=22666 RepID=A0AAN7LCU2_TRANT|nr:hypothetical protein SAY86_018129 [Trapa natans]
MVEDFITRVLLMMLGYAYPAFQCFKVLERNRANNDELRFWCQYWIIMALLNILERVADVIVSWLPMYGELKLAFIIYLWYPKTKGTGRIYEKLLQPFMTNHKTYLEKKLPEWRAKAWDLAIFYYQNCSELGQSAIFQVLDYMSGKNSKTSNKVTVGLVSSILSPFKFLGYGYGDQRFWDIHYLFCRKAARGAQARRHRHLPMTLPHSTGRERI